VALVSVARRPGQQVFLNLAGRGPREIVYADELSRHFVGCEMLTAVCDQVAVIRQRIPGAGQQVGAANFAPFFIATLVDWRFAFIVVGVAGIVVAPIFRATVREPVRGAFDPKGSDSSAPSLKEIMRVLLKKPSFWGLSLAASCSSMMGYGLFFWLPSFFVRSYDVTLLTASLVYGAILLVGGIAGTWLGGSLADRFGETNRSAYARIPAFAFLATVPFYLVGVLSPTLMISVVVISVPTSLGLA